MKRKKRVKMVQRTNDKRKILVNFLWIQWLFYLNVFFFCNSTFIKSCLLYILYWKKKWATISKGFRKKCHKILKHLLTFLNQTLTPIETLVLLRILFGFSFSVLFASIRSGRATHYQMVVRGCLDRLLRLSLDHRRPNRLTYSNTMNELEMFWMPMAEDSPTATDFLWYLLMSYL